MEKALLVDGILLLVSVAVAIFFLNSGDMLPSRLSKVRVRTDDRDLSRPPEPSQEEEGDGDSIKILGLLIAGIIMIMMAQALAG